MGLFKKIAGLSVHFLCAIFLTFSGLAWPQDTSQAKVLQIGILPTLSVRVLLKNYRPLKIYLERELKRPVELVTSVDFKTFHFDTLAGKFDVVVTAAHLARVAQTDAKYIPVATYKAGNRAILLEAKDSPLNSIQDLKGKSVSFGDRNALIVSQTLTYLREQGLREGVDYTLLETQSHTSAAYSVQSHQSVLGITAPSGLQNIPNAVKDSIQVYATLPEIPSLMWLLHPRMASEAATIKAALLGFESDTGEGKPFFEASGYIGMREVSNSEMKALEPYAQDIRNTLSSDK